jgi:hypothetical protein
MILGEAQGFVARMDKPRHVCPEEISSLSLPGLKINLLSPWILRNASTLSFEVGRFRLQLRFWLRKATGSSLFRATPGPGWLISLS